MGSSDNANFTVVKSRSYTVMGNHHLKNKKLSLKAKGLLSVMLSVPDSWKHSIAGYASICRDGVDGVRSAIKELEEHGYITRCRKRNDKGHLTITEYTIYETPIQDKPTLENPTLDNPVLDKPIVDEPSLDNPSQYNINLLTTNKFNIDVSNPNQSNQKIKGYEMMGFDSLDELRELVYCNLEYAHCKQYGPITKLPRIEEIADIIIDTLCYTQDTINIAGQDYPSSMVKDRLLKITSIHVDYVLECLDKNTTHVRNIKRYLLATLFNAPVTMDSYYAALVNHDLYGNK
ncbi:DUF6017 domain-containing protein [Chakrabartyella piscis]|uniref:DUF6017 domain-containing protein n=1 Tax=Chakrabartyella piscis TaxID=2918914 RepID=UPI002958861D|nr:DUF6017 domain-containing protein [Chakrabartyella piscis]